MSSPGNNKKNAIKERVSFKKVHEDSFKVRCMRKLWPKYNASFSYSETSVYCSERKIYLFQTQGRAIYWDLIGLVIIRK